MTVQDLAKEANRYFTSKTRTNGENYLVTSDDAPEWVSDLVRAAHEDMLPEDYRYQFTSEAINALARYEDTDEARDSLEADIYTSDLLQWLASRNDRTYYVDQARDEFGTRDSDTEAQISAGQLYEIHEVFALVLSALEARVEQVSQ